jgi:hypothetical protein
MPLTLLPAPPPGFKKLSTPLYIKDLRNSSNGQILPLNAINTICHEIFQNKYQPWEFFK